MVWYQIICSHLFWPDGGKNKWYLFWYQMRTINLVCICFAPTNCSHSPSFKVNTTFPNQRNIFYHYLHRGSSWMFLKNPYLCEFLTDLALTENTSLKAKPWTKVFHFISFTHHINTPTKPPLPQTFKTTSGTPRRLVYGMQPCLKIQY